MTLVTKKEWMQYAYRYMKPGEYTITHKGTPCLVVHIKEVDHVYPAIKKVVTKQKGNELVTKKDYGLCKKPACVKPAVEGGLCDEHKGG